jgi:cell division septation protein DedD
MAPAQDTEITLSTGRLLGLFFGLAVVCALFFGFGYTLGHSASKTPGSIVAQEGTAPATMPGPGTKPGALGSKAASTEKPLDCASTGADCTAANSSPQQGSNQDMSFYNSVQQKDAPTQLEKSAESKAAPEMKGVPLGSSSLGSGFMVQVAAVSKKEDADLLRSALQGKQYPVVITSLPNDRLFHVQVGPFSDMKEAEAMKTRLTNDGYNPILKK